MAFSIFRNVAVSFVSCRIRRILVHLFFAFDHIYPALCLGSLNSTSSELETCLDVILVLSGTARGSVLTFETKNWLMWNEVLASRVCFPHQSRWLHSDQNVPLDIKR